MHSFSLLRDCYCSITKLCLITCNPIDYSMPDFSVLHYLLQFAQTHVYWVGNAIQPSQPLSSGHKAGVSEPLLVDCQCSLYLPKAREWEDQHYLAQNTGEWVIACSCLDRSGFAVVTILKSQRPEALKDYFLLTPHPSHICFMLFSSWDPCWLIGTLLVTCTWRQGAQWISPWLLKLPPRSGVSVAKAVTWPYFPAGWGAKEDWKHLGNSTDVCHLPNTVLSL